MNFFHIDRYDLILLYLGFAILIASIFPRLLSKYLITAPIVYLGAAILFFSFLMIIRCQASPRVLIGEKD
ncbi:hypothetical protein B879_03543 [Cecembia lonarensis LW9]|uniref:Uncharacterized protein n=1 Tax=Cecembia lonarensis (strain CCUG 58316 / KCTC 22772 / LW9) TaxID=1225176 RepID=K1KUM5_CECL9|nr:hypothetical protein B879_03543 [Cecembia lonarensis LW9]